MVRGLSEVVGGPLGRHAGRHPWWTPLRVALAVTTVVLAVGLLAKAPCVGASAQGKDWPHSRLCHSQVAATYVSGGLAELTWPWTRDEAARARHDAPGLTAVPGYLALGAAHLTHRLTGSPDVAERHPVPTDEVAARPDVRREVQVFTAVTAVLLAGAGLLATWLLAGACGRRSWRAMAYAASPVLVLTWLVGWDLLAGAAVAGVLWAWTRGRPVLTGVLVGLGAAVLLHVAVLLLALPFLAGRRRSGSAGASPAGTPGAPDRSGWGDVVIAWVAAVLAWALVDVPAWAAGPDDWGAAWHSGLGGWPDLGSTWLVGEQVADAQVSATWLVAVSVAVGLAWLVGVWGVVRTARGAGRPPGLAEVGVLLVVGLLLLAPTYAPTHVLVLLPLAAVAVPRWRDQLVWQGGEVLHLAMVGFYVAGALAPTGGGDAPFYWFGVGVRVLAQLWLAGVVVRGLLAPAAARAPEPALSGSRPGRTAWR